ncbi:MAG TPA: rod shape-determining protein MreC [bacterium]
MLFHRNITPYRDYLILVMLIIIALIIISSNHNRQIEYFKMTMVGCTSAVQEKWIAANDYLDLKQKNQQVQSENIRLALENSFMYEMELENQRLRELIGFKQQHEMKLIAAQVIGKDIREGIQSIVLDVGSEDSVTKNMPIVVADGLVGKIYQIGDDYSLGQILFDQNFRVSGKIQRSRVDGIIYWEKGDFCLLKAVPKRSDVAKDDWVITSGYGEIFPPGLKIGQILEISELPNDLFLHIKVNPAVDFEKLEEVFIIKNSKPLR